MTVFIAALVLIVVFAALGRGLGAIRATISLIGLAIAGALAFPLAPRVEPLFTAVGSLNPAWNWVLPPVAVFLAVQIVFLCIGAVVHRKIAWRYKYKSTDEMRHCWERLNARLGICVGAVTGCAYLIILGTIFYATGYLTVQLSTGDTSKDDPRLTQLNQIREDLRATGLDRAIAALDPTPKGFYAAADLAGLLYHNPPLQTKLGDYPALLALAERPEFQDLAKDPQFSEFMLGQPGFMAILNHPKIQPLLANGEVVKEVYRLSPQDLLKFVQTGKSDLFDQEPILGRWLMEPAATFAAAYRRNPQMNPTESRNLKRQLDLLNGLALIATPDNKLLLRGGSLNNAGTWAKAGGAYSANVAGPAINVGRAGGTFDEVAMTDAGLQLKASADGFALIFRKPN